MKLKPIISSSVEMGGILFEDYVVNFGTWSSRKEAKALIRKSLEERRLIRSHEMAKLIQAERVPFYAHVLMTCTHLGTTLKWQMFYLHTSLKFRGISNSGCDLLRKLGMAMARRSYDALAKQIVEVAQRETRYADQHDKPTTRTTAGTLMNVPTDNKQLFLDNCHNYSIIVKKICVNEC
jgi:hypothetical protein